MKVEARVLEVDSTLTGERVGMTIDDGALAHIMSVLTDLYSDPEAAVLREYATNALDSHVEAGVTRPIEVTTPTQLAPFFRVRDFGMGLDADDIRNIYSRYGASTKRASNDVVGMLGLGCKSALTYTDQFTISGTKDGVTTQVSVSRDEDGSGSMTIVAEYETDEPNGVEIIVPTKYGNQFESKANRFFRFWEKGTVLVNDVEPTRIDGMWIADDLLRTQEADYDYVVMGNVAYPMNNQSNYNTWKTIAFVNIGDVQFTPSREALQMTKKTQAALEVIRQRVNSETLTAVNRLINAAATKQEAMKVALNSSSLLGQGNYKTADFKFKGQVIPMEATPKRVKSGEKDSLGNYKLVREQNFISLNSHSLGRNGRSYGKGWSDYTQSIPASVWDNTLWLTGFEDADFSTYKKQKLSQWFAKQTFATHPAQIILCKHVPTDVVDWMNAKTIRPWAEVAAEKIVRENVQRNDGRPTGSYKGYVNGVSNYSILAEEIDTSHPILYVSLHDDVDGIRTFLNRFYTNYTVVTLGLNRIAKFERDFPTAQRFSDAKKSLAEKWLKGLSDADKLAIHLHCELNIADELHIYDPTQIDDPELAAAVEAAKVKTDATDEFYVFRYIINYPSFKWDNPLKKYHLLTEGRFYGSMGTKLKNHVYLYLNAAYAAGQEN